MVYRVPAAGSAAPAKVGGERFVSLFWFNITALRWWDPG
jgi:hypothetical protein